MRKKGQIIAQLLHLTSIDIHSLFCRYETLMKDKDASFTSLQDSEQKLCGFLHCLLDTIDQNNNNLQQKATKAALQQLDHAVQA